MHFVFALRDLPNTNVILSQISLGVLSVCGGTHPVMRGMLLSLRLFPVSSSPRATPRSVRTSYPFVSVSLIFPNVPQCVYLQHRARLLSHNVSTEFFAPITPCVRWCLAWEISLGDTSRQRPSWRPRRPREPRNVPQKLPQAGSVAGGGFLSSWRAEGWHIVATTMVKVDFRRSGVDICWRQRGPILRSLQAYLPARRFCRPHVEGGYGGAPIISARHRMSSLWSRQVSDARENISCETVTKRSRCI